MSIKEQVAANLGKIAANIVGNPRFHAAGAMAAAGTAIRVLTKKGLEARASHAGSISDDKKKIAEVYEDNEGHHYAVVAGKTYRYDQNTGEWHNA